MADDFTDKELWGRIQEIRSNYKDINLLKELINKWDIEIDAKLMERAGKLIANASRNYWVSKSENGNSLNHLFPILWDDWTEGEFTADKSDQSIQMHVTKCPMADAFLEVGRPDLGKFFFCDEDPHIVNGFNPKIKFTRTKAIMLNDGYCNHFYSLEVDD
jgi:hypothetical protein